MRFIIRWLIGILMVVGVVLTLVPFAIKWYVLDQLQAKGYQARIRHIGFDFIFGEITLYDVEIRSAEGEAFTVFSSTFDMDMKEIFAGRLVINKATVDTAHIDVRRDGDNIRVAGFDQQAWVPKFGRDIAIEMRYLSMTNSEICRDYQAQCLRIENASIGRARFEQSASKWSFSHASPVSIQKAFLREHASNATLFYVGELLIDRGDYTTGAVTLNQLQLKNVQYIESDLDLDKGAAEAPYQTQIGELMLSSLAWKRADTLISIDLGPVAATSVRQALQRNASGQLLLPEQLKTVFADLNQRWQDKKLQFSLAELSAEDGALVWTDHSVTPPASGQLSGLNARLGRIDSRVTQDPTSFNVAGKLGAIGQLKFKGDVYPLLEPAQFAFSGLIESLELASLTGYTPAWFNHRIEKGLIDVAIDAKAEQGLVKATTRWQWTDFVIQPGRMGGADMPLDASYRLLKDHNNSVRFSVDISGKAGSDSLTLRNILAAQTRRALSNMARGYVKSAGAVAPVGGASSGALLSFEPLYYAANARYPLSEDQPRIKEIANLLVGKAQLKMTFCAVMTGGEWADIFSPGQLPSADAEILPEQLQSLLDLANARGRTLTTALMNAGVARDKIILCPPRVELAETGPSYMSVSL